MNKKLLNSGFSLAEILVAIGMLGGLSLIVMNFTKMTTKSSVKYQFDSDVLLITNEINSILSDPTKCMTTFTNPAQTSMPMSINGKYYISTHPSAPANGYGNSGLKITKYSLAGTYPDGVLTISFENKKILSGPSSITKNVRLYVQGTPGNITSCRSISSSTTDLWSKLTPTSPDIYYIGNVGIGKSAAPTAKLDVLGNVNVVGIINATGTITSASDIRLKKDLSFLDNSLEKILNLRGKEFNWRNKDFGKGRQIGFIAQEVEAIYPELVFTNEQGIKSVAYQNLVAPLVEAIREQQLEIETLKAALCETNPNLKVCDN